jgi:hypothetical protein
MKRNILYKIINSVLTEQSFKIPVRIDKYSVDMRRQKWIEEAGGVFAFRVTSKSKEQETAPGLKQKPAEPQILQAIKQFLSKTTSEDVKKYLNGNYWLIYTDDLSPTEKYFQYLFSVFPKNKIESIANPIMINNPNEFKPKVDFYVNSTPVSHYSRMQGLIDDISTQNYEWLWNNASRDRDAWDKTVNDIADIASSATPENLPLVTGWKTSKYKQRLDQLTQPIRNSLVFLDEPSFLNRETETLTDSEFYLQYPYDINDPADDKHIYLFTGKSVFIKASSSGNVRKHTGDFKKDNATVFKGTVLDNENNRDLPILTGNAINLEIKENIYFTGYITNSKITYGTIIDSIKDIKYEGSFEFTDNGDINLKDGLVYQDDVLTGIWEKGEGWDYVRDSALVNVDSMYQIKELQEDIIKMWSNNMEFVNSASPDTKNMINKFIQNGSTGIWDDSMKDMVYVLNTVFGEANPDGSTPEGYVEISQTARQKIIELQTSKIQ